MARHARRVRPARLLPLRPRLRLARARAGRRARAAARRPTAASARSSRRPAGSTSSSRGTQCSCAPTTGRRTCTRGDGSRTGAGAGDRHGLESRRDDLHRRAARRRDEPRRRRGGRRRRSSSRTATSSRAATATRTPALLDEFPLGRERVEAALRNPNAGDVLVSAAHGWEFADLAGSHHAGGGSHGSLVVGDSEVPMLGGRHRAARAHDRRQGRAAREPARAVTDDRRAPTDGRGAASRAAPSTTRACSTAMERVPRELFVPEDLRDARVRRRGASDRQGQTISQPAMVALICELLAPARHRARARRRHRFGLPGGGPRGARRRGAHGRAPARARGAGATEPRRPPDTRARRRPRRGRGRWAIPTTRRSHAIAVAAAAPEPPPTLYEQLEPGGRLVLPVGSEAGPAPRARRAQPGGPRGRALRSLPLRAARRRGRLRARLQARCGPQTVEPLVA